ncbi:MAG: FKBP-type peptidyl-prolyl cis-trans isomerase [Coriobacteriia bacterium]|nr:FKBP-type peptidyl-prolyl cis-trans isomerase [Coriobacteriia bacterium]
MKTLPETKAKTYTVKKLKIEDLRIGEGRKVKNGDKISVIYTGTLTDGTQFDQNTVTNLFTFTVGHGEVIKGFDEGVVGMKVGGGRKVTIPANMGYGSEGSGKIPGGATIIFTIDFVRFAN